MPVTETSVICRKQLLLGYMCTSAKRVDPAIWKFLLLVDYRGGCTGALNAHSWVWHPVLVRYFSLYFSISYPVFLIPVLNTIPLDSVMIFSLQSKWFCQLLALPSLCRSHLRLPYLSCVFSLRPQTVRLICLFLLFLWVKHIGSVFPFFLFLCISFHTLPSPSQQFMRSCDNLNSVFSYLYSPCLLVVQ